MRVGRLTESGNRPGGDGPKRGLIETLGRRPVEPLAARQAKRVRGGRAKSWPRPSRQALEGRTPRELPIAAGAKTTGRRTELPVGKKPRNRNLAGRPDASAMGTSAGETVGGFLRSETAGYLRDGQAPKGRIPGAPPV